MESSINSWTAGASPIAIVHNRLVVGQSTSRSWLFPGATVGPAPQFGENELVPAGLHAAPSTVVKPPRILESPVSLECKEWGTSQIGDNRVVIGLVKRVHLREELSMWKGNAFGVTSSFSSAAWPRRTGIAAPAIVSR
jgi:flavin reductase (DIM6/NTAB) family NADH-FMN oxidoreductase RutF